MASWFVIFLVPIAIYLILALTSFGSFVIRFGIIATLSTASLWLAYYLDIQGIGGRDGPQGAYTFIFLIMMTLAIGLATCMQLLRRRFPPEWPDWSWPLCVLLTLLAVGWPVFGALML